MQSAKRYYSKNSEKIAATNRLEYSQNPNPWRNQVKKGFKTRYAAEQELYREHIVAIRLCCTEVRETAVGRQSAIRCCRSNSIPKRYNLQHIGPIGLRTANCTSPKTLQNSGSLFKKTQHAVGLQFVAAVQHWNAYTRAGTEIKNSTSYRSHLRSPAHHEVAFGLQKGLGIEIFSLLYCTA